MLCQKPQADDRAFFTSATAYVLVCSFTTLLLVKFI